MIAAKQIYLGQAVSAPVQTYDVYVKENWQSDWTVVMTLGDGSMISPTQSSQVVCYHNVASIAVTGIPYVHLTDGSAKWYRVLSHSGSRIYFNGESNSYQMTYQLSLEEDMLLDYVIYVSPGGCFSENMLIRMADGTDKPIGEIKPGDKVKAYNCNRTTDSEEIIDSTVEYSSSGVVRVAQKYDKYTFSDGTVIEVVNRDRVYNVESNKMKWMDRWDIGEHGLTYDGREIALVSHETIHEPIKMHDFTCEYYNFFINGMLAGQKRARYPFFPSRFVHNN